MNKLFTTLAGTLAYFGGSLALAHPGHQVEGVIGQAGHSFSAADFILLSLLAAIVIYSLIKGTR
jgi:hypothetical protein